MSKILKGALQWAAQGVPVFPCSSATKQPLTPNGFYDGSTDPTTVTAMFDAAGDDVYIGARMGNDSGLFAVDVDLYKDGAQDQFDAMKDAGLIPDTQRHTTARGGIHLLYKGAAGCAKPHPAIDIKGEGGYVIVPPSDGYRVRKRGINEAPPDLINWIGSSRKEKKRTTDADFEQNVLSGKDFHDSLTMIAARMAARGRSPLEVVKRLKELMEASLASSETHARHSRWRHLMHGGDNEIARIASSAHEKYNTTGSSEAVRESVGETFSEEGAQAAEAFFGASASQAGGTAQTEIPKFESEEDWPFEDQGYFANEDFDIADEVSVLHPLLHENETVLIAAEPKAGKTAIALKLAFTTAVGDSMGKSLLVDKPRGSLYYGLEGRRAVKLRIAAEKARYKDQGKELPEQLPLFVVEKSSNLSDPEVQKVEAAKMVQADRYFKKKTGEQLGIIFIDTLTKAMPGRDQNSVEDTSALFEIVSLLRNNGVVATIVFIHHLSRAGQVRGSTNIEAEVDVVCTVEKHLESGLTELRIKMARSVEDGVSYFFRLSGYDLGTTSQGYRLSAPVVDLSEDVPATASSEAVKESFEFSALCEAALGLGVGYHKAAAVIKAWAATVPSRAQKPTAAKMKKLLEGKTQFSFSNHLFDVDRVKGTVTGIRIRKVEA